MYFYYYFRNKINILKMIKNKFNNFSEKKDLLIKGNFKISIKLCTSKCNYKTPEK